MRRLSGCVASAALILALMPAVLHAQVQSPPLRSDAIGGLHLGIPAIVSIGLGGYRELSRDDTTDAALVRAVFALAEPGVNAGRLSVGYGVGLPAILTGATIRLTALRAWRGTVGNYVGTEGSMSLFGLSPRLGFFVRRGGPRPSPVRVALDLGFGL